MWAFAEKVLGFFTPPAMDDLVDSMEITDLDRYSKINKSLRSFDRWGYKISWTFAAIALYVAWTFTPWGFVRAGTQDVKVEAKLASTEKRLTAIEAQTSALQIGINELIAQKVALDICRVTTRMKTETTVYDRTASRGELDAYQTRYRSLTGAFYPEDRCI